MARMRALDAVMALVGFFVLAGCGKAEAPGEQRGGERLAATRQALATDGQQCVTIQRGQSGAVEDAILWQNMPTWNDGARLTLSTGTSASGGVRRSVLRFDLSAIPAGATVNAATLSVYQLYKNVEGTVAGHVATAAWTEATVKWGTFGDNFNPASFGSFVAPGGGSTGWRTLDATAPVQAWVSGASPNHGVVLIETGASYTDYRSSESASADQRPKLDVCYVTCTDGTQNGNETGVDCGGPSCPSCCVPSPEVCDGIDNDCDGAVDDGLCQTPPDACHAAGSCDIASGQCVFPDAPNGTACNDGNGCTQTDACQAGACVGGNPVACAPVDGCHDAGTCDPATGACSVGPALADGTACDDGNGCTQGDACQAGACAAGAPVVCAPVDDCHGAGTCQPATGACADGPALGNGTACDDGNADTEFDTCQAGSCTGANSVVVTIQMPIEGTIAAGDTIQVLGTVDQPVSSVRIGEVQAAVNGQSFSATVPLHEGSNILAVEATGQAGNPGSASTTVLLDTRPPRVAITQPADKALIVGNVATVTGSVQDMVIGAVGIGDCAVTVNGIAAEVENGGFRAENVPVAEGPGTITVVATDAAGNVGSAVIEVTGNLASNAMIVAAGGDAQTGVVGGALGQPLQVQLLDNTGQPVPNMEVRFQVTRSNGALGNGARSESVFSDAQGFASTTLTLGASAGAGSDQVTATAAGFLGAATFAANAVPDPTGPRVLTVASIGVQRGAPGSLAPLPLAVFLSDGSGNPVANQDVTFTVRRGGGRVDGASSVVKASDFDGRVFALLTMGDEIGEGTQVVEATAQGGNKVTFVGSTVAAADPSQTTLSGLVLTNENDPIANALVEIEGMGIQGVTDAEGRFALSVPLPAGTVGYKRVHLDVRGATGGPFPSELEFELDLIPGAENTMDRPVYLPAVDTDGVVTASEAADAVVRRPDVPGFSFTVPAGSATFVQEEVCASDADCAGGGSCVDSHCRSKTGQIQVITVHNDKIPMLPSDGAIPTLAFAIMPHTAHFDPPAPIRMPNVDGRAPGEVVSLYSYDHDLGQFVIVGTATVSEDGQEIVSERGQGIVKGGWHYVPPKPVPPMCVSGNCCIKSCDTASSCVYVTQTAVGSGLPTKTPCGAPYAPSPSEQWSPDVDCYVSFSGCDFDADCDPLDRTTLGPASCVRGYDGDHPLLTGLQGLCMDPVDDDAAGDHRPVCCPNSPDQHICPFTLGGGNVCCPAPCSGGADPALCD